MASRKADHHFDLLVDDAPHEISAAREAGCAVTMRDPPYNQHPTGDRVGGVGPPPLFARLLA